ncbi:MAG: hypothetical protein K0B11_21770 [Mariniphaga sp.]|nr:hypothetical protein [Mariniphaga sp.]
MKKGKEIMLTDSMEGFQGKAINYNDYEVSFRRWLVKSDRFREDVLPGSMGTIFLPQLEYKKIIYKLITIFVFNKIVQK